MQISIFGHGLKVTDALRAHIGVKCVHLERDIPDLHTLDVMLSTQSTKHGGIKTAHLMTHRKRVTYHVEESATGPQVAFDLALDKLRERIIRDRDRRLDRAHTSRTDEEVAARAEAR